MTTTVVELPAYASQYRFPGQLDAWLASVVNHYAEREVPLPDRRYWTVGQATHDCQQIVLTLRETFLGLPGADPTPTVCTVAGRSVTVSLEIVRCAPTTDKRGNIPSPEEIQLAGALAAIDMEILLDVATYFDPDDTGIMVTVNALPSRGGLIGAMGVYTTGLL